MLVFHLRWSLVLPSPPKMHRYTETHVKRHSYNKLTYRCHELLFGIHKQGSLHCTKQNESPSAMQWVLCKVGTNNRTREKRTEAWWCISVVPATWEAEARGTLKKNKSKNKKGLVNIKLFRLESPVFRKNRLTLRSICPLKVSV